MSNLSLHRRGFTIIECLVVVTIISVLIAMLLPALSTSRDVTKVTTCEINLRTQSFASAAYATDNKTYLCLSYDGNSGNAGAGIAADTVTLNYNTPDFLADYVESGTGITTIGGSTPFARMSKNGRSVFSCPARTFFQTGTTIPLATGANAQVHIYRQIDNPSSGVYVLRDFKKADVVRRPNEVVEFTDSCMSGGNTSVGWIGSSDASWFNDPTQQKTLLYTYPLYPVNSDVGSGYWFRWRHMNNNINVSSHFDGHAGSFDTTSLTYRNVGVNY